MPNLNTEEIKKLKTGELLGLIALIGCGVALIAFIVMFTVATVRADEGLRLAALISFPCAMAAFSLVAAICNLKYGRAIDRIIKNYVRDVFIENAALMHPERDSLTYYVSFEGCEFYVKANNFKERIVFDFSAFKKLSAVRRAGIFTAIVERLGATFCRLFERGGKFKSVSYCVFKGGKQGKSVNIIENGAPDKKAYKNYLKTK